MVTNSTVVIILNSKLLSITEEVRQSGVPNGLFPRNICSVGINRPRYLHLNAVKARDQKSKTSPQTFVTRELINSYCFWRDKCVV